MDDFILKGPTESVLKGLVPTESLRNAKVKGQSITNRAGSAAPWMDHGTAVTRLGFCRSFDRRQPVTVQVKDAVPPGVANTNSAGAPGVLNTSCSSR